MSIFRSNLERVGKQYKCLAGVGIEAVLTMILAFTPPSIAAFQAQLQRAGAAEEQLPAANVAKTPAFWDENKKYVIGALTLIVFQTALVGWLLLERRRRLMSEDARLKLAAIVESSEDAIIAVSLDGEIQNWNGGAELMYGYTAAEILGRPISVIVPSDRLDELSQCLAKIKRAERIEDFETVRLKKDGTQIDVSVSVCFIKDSKGRNTAAASIGRDISRRKRAEEALRESEERFRNLADTAPVLVWMSGPDQLCTYFNRAWLQFTGRTIDQELGNGWTEGVHPADYEQCLKTYVTAFEARQDFCMEYRLRRYDGEYGWIIDTGVPRYTAAGTFAGYIGSALDITERKRAEEQSQRLAVRLLNLQDTERRRLARELHDVTAQNLFVMSINLSRLERGDLDPPVTRSLLAELKQLCDQALQEIRTLSYVLHPPMLDRAGLVGALRWYIEGFVKRSGIKIETSSIKEIGRLSPDIETALFRIVQESLTNIRRHSDSSSASIRLERHEDEIVLQITDNGRGMAKADSLDMDNTESLGVGIPGMRQRLRQFGGTLQVESDDRGVMVMAKIPASSGVIDNSHLGSGQSEASA